MQVQGAAVHFFCQWLGFGVQPTASAGLLALSSGLGVTKPSKVIFSFVDGCLQGFAKMADSGGLEQWRVCMAVSTKHP